MGVEWKKPTRVLTWKSTVTGSSPVLGHKKIVRIEKKSDQLRRLSDILQNRRLSGGNKH